MDLLVSFDAKDRRAVYDHIVQDIKEKYPDYTPLIALDTDFSET